MKNKNVKMKSITVEMACNDTFTIIRYGAKYITYSSEKNIFYGFTENDQKPGVEISNLYEVMKFLTDISELKKEILKSK